ncbi:MAG: type II toxin-antitoxin system RelE/ParE family toxin [Bacteroidales bacterium]|nr:type II toxin-antitoxin system RelE/ParE family toxin [Bacteroidales bacterium]
MNIIWTDKADELLAEIAEFILLVYGETAHNKFLSEVYETVLLLATNPYMGKIEPSLSDHSICYRSIVVNHINKVVYIAEEESIVVVAIWDCRRDPYYLASNIE